MARSARSDSWEDVNWVYEPVDGVRWVPCRVLLNIVRAFGLHKVQVSSSLYEQLMEVYEVFCYIQIVCRLLLCANRFVNC
jgi:hypothetical protein